MLGCQSTGDPRKTTRGVWTPNALGGCAWPVPRPGGVWGPVASRRGFWFHSFPSGGSRLASGRRQACAPPHPPGSVPCAGRSAPAETTRPLGSNGAKPERATAASSAEVRGGPGVGAAARKCLCGRGEAAWCPEGRPGLSPCLASCLPLRSLGFLTYTLGPGPGDNRKGWLAGAAQRSGPPAVSGAE